MWSTPSWTPSGCGSRRRHPPTHRPRERRRGGQRPAPAGGLGQPGRRQRGSRRTTHGCPEHRLGLRPVAADLSGPAQAPADESMPLDLTAADPRLTTVAAVSDLEGAVSAMPEGVVLRYGMLYGPDTWFQPGGPRADAAAAGLLAADRSVTSFLHVDHAAAAAVQALPWPPGLTTSSMTNPPQVSSGFPISVAASACLPPLRSRSVPRGHPAPPIGSPASAAGRRSIPPGAATGEPTAHPVTARRDRWLLS